MNKYLFEFEFSGSTWSMTVDADCEDGARARVAAMGGATLQGILAETIWLRTADHLRVVTPSPGEAE